MFSLQEDIKSGHTISNKGVRAQMDQSISDELENQSIKTNISSNDTTSYAEFKDKPKNERTFKDIPENKESNNATNVPCPHWMKSCACVHNTLPMHFKQLEGQTFLKYQNFTKMFKPNEKYKKQFEETLSKEKKDKTEKSGPEKIEIYYFDHGNSAFYQTTDSSPVLATDYYAEKTENAAGLFWAELFGILNIGLAFVTAFILQFLRFLMAGLFRPLTIGLIQLMSDYCLKPFLAVIFNAIIQPPLIFIYNILCSLSDLFQPIARAAGYFGNVFSDILRSVRLVDVNRRYDV